MKYENVTLTNSNKAFEKAMHITIENNVSLSELSTGYIEQKDDAYLEAGKRHRELLSQGMELGTNRSISWQRCQLYEK